MNMDDKTDEDRIDEIVGAARSRALAVRDALDMMSNPVHEAQRAVRDAREALRVAEAALEAAKSERDQSRDYQMLRESAADAEWILRFLPNGALTNSGNLRISIDKREAVVRPNGSWTFPNEAFRATAP